MNGMCRGSGTEAPELLPKKDRVSPVKPLQRHTPIASVALEIKNLKSQKKKLKSISLRLIAFRTVITSNALRLIAQD
jgi:hypothetical protein